MARWTTCTLALLLLLAACGEPAGLGPGPGEPSPAQPAPGEPSPAEGAERHPDAIWFEVLDVSTEAGEIGEVALAESADDLAPLWERHGFDGAPPGVDFAEQVVAVVVRPENACPDELVEARLVDGTVETTFLEPPGACPEPLIPTAYAIAFHRADLPEEVTVRFRASEALGGDIAETFALPPYEGPDSPAPSPPPEQMDEAALDEVFADHPIRRCDELPDPRDGAFGDGPSSVQTDHPDVPQDIQERYAAEHADSFGCLMLDSVQDELVVGVTDDVDGHRERLTARHPDVPIRVEETPFTQEELLEAQEAVMPLHDPATGPEVSSSSAFAYLELGVIDPTREDLDAIAGVVDPAMTCVDPILSGLPPDQR